MPLPEWSRLLPRKLNRALRPAAAYLPPLAVLHHTGRRSGTHYDTPVQAYRVDGGFLVACAYSEHPQWAQNLLASGTGSLSRTGRSHTLTNPRALGPEGLQLLPAPVAALMRRIGVSGFMRFDSAR